MRKEEGRREFFARTETGGGEPGCALVSLHDVLKISNNNNNKSVMNE